MTWFKVDDKLHGHRKTRKAKLEAMGLWTVAGSYCADHLTEGFVDIDFVEQFPRGRQLAERLVAAGYWTAAEVDGDQGYQFHDWSVYQPSKESVEADRAASKERQRRARERGRAALRERESQGSHAVTHAVTDADVTPGVTVPPTRPDPTRPVLPTEVPPSGEKRAKRATALERGWKPSDEVARAIRAEVPGINLAAEHAKFIDNFTGNGKLMKDWEAVWRNWMRRSPQFAGPAARGMTSTPTPSSPKRDEACTKPGHSGWAGNCAQCRSEALAAPRDHQEPTEPLPLHDVRQLGLVGRRVS